jgi:hypothetical protein
VTPACARGRHATAPRCGPWLLALLLTSVGCLQRPVDNPNILVISMSLRLSPIVGFSFLRDVARVRPAAN